MLPELTTQRLILRELQMSDAPDIQTYQSKPDQWKHQAVEPDELADAKQRIQGYLDHKGPDGERWLFVFAVREKETNEIVGQVSLTRSHPVIGHLGFGVDTTKTGKGYATEMCAALVRFAFIDVGLHRLDANVAVENHASIRVLEKLSMVKEGVTREAIFAQGRWWDEAVYSMLENELQADI
ncbi:MAG: GNAT family protein [Pseudomonadota bacterium]